MNPDQFVSSYYRTGTQEISNSEA